MDDRKIAMKYDYVIVGAGLFGSVFAREITDAGASCIVIDKRHHIGGNCYTKDVGGIAVHQYGPHIFHTNNDRIWQYMNRWCEFNRFSYRPKVRHEDSIYSFPINMMTLYQLWGVKTPEEAQHLLNTKKVPIENPSNLEEWILSQVGEEIYKKFIYGYTKKQWGRDPKQLPSFIIKRIPIRLTWNDDYFDDKYQGIPIGGYTQIFDKLLAGIPVETNVNYLVDRNRWDSLGKRVVYTGGLDEFFDFSLGELEWRSLRFEHETLETSDYQGNAAINYTSENIPYTRVMEHKHFEFGKQKHTVVTKEYPQQWDRSKEKYYPINDTKNNELFSKYKNMVNRSKYIMGGRLANYRYYDMHQIVGAALREIENEKTNRYTMHDRQG